MNSLTEEYLNDISRISEYQDINDLREHLRAHVPDPSLKDMKRQSNQCPMRVNLSDRYKELGRVEYLVGFNYGYIGNNGHEGKFIKNVKG